MRFDPGPTDRPAGGAAERRKRITRSRESHREAHPLSLRTATLRVAIHSPEARMSMLSNTLESLELGAAVSAANLTMVPLLARQAFTPDYLLLDDALEAGLAEVTEVSKSGAVPELAFRNRAELDVLLVDGEELVGAKQNRVLNLTILVGAGQDVKIPVSCVEAGRWAWRSQRFAAGKRKLHAKARLAKMRGVSASLHEDGARARSDVQAAIWRSIDDKMQAFACRSETSALHDAYAATEARLREVRAAFAPHPRQVGAAFFVNGALVGLELFDAPATLAKLLPKLVDSYAFDALEEAADTSPPSAPSLDQVRALLARIANAPQTSYPSVATGTDLRIEDAGVHAAALYARQRIVHLSAFVCAREDGQ